jgi:valyl-tRNA synthetase
LVERINVTVLLCVSILPGTTVGQDLNLSLDRVTANRNFTNKLWNAGGWVGDLMGVAMAG